MIKVQCQIGLLEAEGQTDEVCVHKGTLSFGQKREEGAGKERIKEKSGEDSVKERIVLKNSFQTTYMRESTQREGGDRKEQC